MSARTFTLLSTSDTDLLSARASASDWKLGNPYRVGTGELAEFAAGTDLVVVRILGAARKYEDMLRPLLDSGLPVVVLGGEQLPDAELMALSTVPMGVATDAHAYLAQGGPDNIVELHRFLADTVLLDGEGFDAPAVAPDWGLLDRPTSATGPRIAVLYYRAHHLAGNTAFVHTLCEAIETAGGVPVPVYTASLRSVEPEMLDVLRTVDAMVVTVLAAGGSKPATASAGGDDGAWDVGELARLDVPVIQGLVLGTPRATWAANDDGLSPLDVGNQVAIPEFDGRIISVPFSFKEVDADGLTSYVPDLERAARVAGTAVAHARLRHTAPADRKIVVMLSAYPTKHARIGNAVGLDTPASVVRLLAAMAGQGYDIGPFDGEGSLPGVADLDGDRLVHALIEAGGQDPDWLTAEQLSGNPVRIPAAEYRRFFDTLPAELTDRMVEHWGPPPGELFVDPTDDCIVFAALRAGNVVVMVQPPRGFGENPIAIYHDPDLPPSHHYLAAYHWLRSSFGAHAVVHVGKHGNLEWMPGKTVGLSASCAPDAALGDLPMVYPFLVNDPGEGSQAKRRAHAVLIDHMVPPMARAETYGDIARLEQLLDEHANIAAMDPPKLPAVRQQIWTLIQAAKLDHDLGLDDRPHDAEFDEMILHVDGWLCAIKDSQIRDGLHVFGSPPEGDARVGLVLAILRARQIWGGSVAMPGLREALGLVEDGSAGLHETDEVEARALALVTAMEAAGWTTDAVEPTVAEVLGGPHAEVSRVLDFAVAEVVPRLAKTTDEIDMALHALDGGYVPAGPSGSPLRGLVNVLPTGRNFYSVDPRAVPSRLAWETGQGLAESLVERYVSETGEHPRSVGLSVWGTSAMRTSGDDVAQVLALLGVRPVWDEASRRVTKLEPIPLGELGRPRIDVTVRISGFFRDAFPHVVTMLDDAVTLAAGLEETPEQNYVKAHVDADVAEHGDRRRATTRVFGSKPGAYGAGLLSLIDSRDWRTDADLAEVYAVWGGYAYGRDLDGVAARADMETSYRRIAVAAKNIDTREHDIADSDDYFQYHGGMVATVRALTGSSPKAYIGDSTRPEHVRTRSLVEETSRVFRARVVNPKWLAAMRRHGYKGAFEMAATVDYLFGYDATTGVVADWMYEKLAQSYVLDPENREFMEQSNPWALHGIAERLLEAVERKMWAEPDPALLAELQQAYLDTEGDLEGGETPAQQPV
ncbi:MULTISPECIES: cobaltochelatase subunit CobN [unclassified Modestobacter]|uniref:cobaltochelatase subunit CobN n=1 Tax=unclassified Modestobacter TaxID=2643866 RepID=UPI0022AA0FD7|nr:MULTISPECIES: cobaltochelatase subunit CobN [unclassified Modestobacter]MCZ2825377.1 cobaltochelatase subunit CobN [Modestobacter sp. VKM Ac-2981]MCZ2853558.1 cobaltochelatase subunit CobN [Modestobacter sp. VKM Ac-2982]